MIRTFEEILLRDLNALKNEISQFKKTDDLWFIKGDIKNPAGVLSQHLCGNLKHFIGSVLGKTGYMRNRDLEFSQKNLSGEELIRNVEETMEAVKKTFSKLDDTILPEKYPLPFAGKEVTVFELLVILTSHFGYHLGQINYLRRIQE